MTVVRFEWDEKKTRENQKKHGVPFSVAQYAFADPHRVIAEDVSHSQTEQRCYCFGRTGDRVMAVRSTYRHKTIRIIGAGFWRRGTVTYEQAQR